MIAKTTTDKAFDICKIEDVVSHCQPELKKKGASLKGICPSCGSDSFTVTPAKQLYKCFSCGIGGKHGIQYLQKIKGYTYPEAIKWICEYYKINIEMETEVQAEVKALEKKRRQKDSPSFRDTQLTASGLTELDQQCEVEVDADTTKTICLYEAATLNEKWQVVEGDDMVMRYIDLNGKPMKYSRKGFSKEYDLIRIRWGNPDLHLDKNGKPIKYQSPKDSGTALWINNWLRKKYGNRIQFDTLFIQEGEKKADKASKHGLTSVGIMGIHNIANNKRLPHEFELIIKFCGVKNVVFVTDSDWDEIGNSLDDAIDTRPKTFLRAINNFKDYFFSFNNQGINLELFFAYVRKNDKKDKGVDDLLVNTLAGKEHELKADFEFAMNEKTGEGKYINCHKITGHTYYNLQEYFKLGDINEFANYHRDKLVQRKIFKIGREKFKFKLADDGTFAKDPDTKKYILELAQPLGNDEQFWMEEETQTRNGVRKQLQFDYENGYKFLFNRGYGRMFTAEGTFIFVNAQNSIVRQVQPYEIKDYMIDFTKQLGRKDLTNMMYRGAKMYAGPDSLSNIDFIEPTFHKCGKGLQYLYFQETFWKITNEGIKELPIKELDGSVWNNQVIDFNAKYIPEPMFTITSKEQLVTEGSKKTKKSYNLHINEDSGLQCHLLMFLWNTSNFYWEKEKRGEKLSEMEMDEVKMHFLSKLTAIGYLLHTYRDDNVAKAVIAMDGKMSEVGQSNGRSGKSLMGTAIAEIIPTCYIPGKQKDLTDDKFIFEEVNERTKLVFLDDVRVNVDFEFFFPMITGQMKIEGKGIKRYTLPKDRTPKLLLTTNHAINGDSGSFTDRQILLAFSDFYHKRQDGSEHRPIDDFGVMMFTEWDYNQRNLFMNFMATCLVAYFQHGLILAPQEKLEKRRLRQQMGEAFLEWAEEYFCPEESVMGGSKMNCEIPKTEMCNAFHERFPRQKAFVDVRDFKKKVKIYCQYKNFMMNPGHPEHGKPWGGDNKKGGIEYITVANDRYSINNKPAQPQI